MKKRSIENKKRNEEAIKAFEKLRGEIKKGVLPDNIAHKVSINNDDRLEMTYYLISRTGAEKEALLFTYLNEEDAKTVRRGLEK